MILLCDYLLLYYMNVTTVIPGNTMMYTQCGSYKQEVPQEQLTLKPYTHVKLSRQYFLPGSDCCLFFSFFL